MKLEAKLNANGDWIVFDPDVKPGGLVATMESPHGKDVAQLFAAAPDILEALQEVLAMFHVADDGLAEDEKAVLDAAYDAVEKATGKD